MTQLQEPRARFRGIIRLGRFATDRALDLFGRRRGRTSIQTVSYKVEEPAFVDGVVGRRR